MKIFGHKGKRITKEIPELDTLKTELRRERYKRRFRRLLRRTVDALIVVAAIAAIIATPGDYLWIEPDGTVFVNGNALDEPYVRDKALGECDIEFPYQVPENAFFMMGDQRETSIDSRSSVIGCIPADHTIGKILCKFWPLSQFEWLG